MLNKEVDYYSDDEPKPPSIRPLDDDEDSFLGDFKTIISKINPTTTSPSPPTRKFRTDLHGDSFSTQESRSVFKKRKEGPKKIKNLSDLVAGHHFEAPKAQKPDIDQEEDSDLPKPKNRHPKVAKGGWKPMHGPESNENHSHHAKFHQQPQPRDPMRKIYLDYTRENRMRKPVRVEMTGAKRKFV